MRNRNTHNRLSLTTKNPFRGKASLVLRCLLAGPSKSWTGIALAQELGLSSAWVNRIIGTLEIDRYITRSGTGPKDKISLIKPKELLDRWRQVYSINRNHMSHYFIVKGDPLKILPDISNKLSLNYALTGYAVANKVSKSVTNAIPMVYLWPKSGKGDDLKWALIKLENLHRFLPVGKGANIIVLEPFQKDSVFFGAHTINRMPCVSPLQLYLDLAGLDRGEFVIKELKGFWKKNGMDYVV